MVSVGDVRVIVDQRRVAVRVAMGLVDRTVVHVLVMLVVGVTVLVLEGFVGVLVAVSRYEEYRDTSRQEQARSGVAEGRPLAEERNGEGGAREGSGCEEGCLAAGPEETQGISVEENADAVADAAEQERCGHGLSGRELRAERQRNDQAERASEERLGPGQHQRVAKREPLRQVVVDSPDGTRACEGEHAEPVDVDLAGPEAEEGGAYENQDRARRFEAPEVFPEERDGDQDRERALEVEKKRSDDSRKTAEAPEHEERADHAAGHGDRPEERPVPPAKRGLGLSFRRSGPSAQGGQAEPESGAQVEERGE